MHRLTHTVTGNLNSALVTTLLQMISAIAFGVLLGCKSEDRKGPATEQDVRAYFGTSAEYDSEGFIVSVTGFPQEKVPLLVNLTRLRIVDATDFDWTDHDLELIRRLPSLEQLEIRCHPDTNDGFAVLSTLPNLRRLKLIFADLRWEGMKHISECGRLQAVAFVACDLPDDPLQHLTELSDLRSYAQARCRGGSGGFEELPTFQRLRKLSLDHGRESFPWKHLSELQSLEELDIHHDLSDEELALLLKMPRLRLLGCGFEHREVQSRLEKLNVNLSLQTCIEIEGDF